MADSKREFEALLRRLAAPAHVPNLPGQPLAQGSELGGYRVVRLLGQGGMGEVYEVEPLAGGARFALKCLSRGLALDACACARFESEAQAAGRLHHPNIVRALGAGCSHDGRPYLLMELFESESLQQELSRSGALPWPRLRHVALQLCHALQAAHAAGLVHRDLKPGNVLVGPGHPPEVKLSDFGVAKLLAEPAARLTTTGITLGTPHFMAPEQVRGDASIDGRADLYALGVLLYYGASGSLPFQAKSFAELAVQICSACPAALCTLRPDLPAGVQALVERAMHKEPSQRFADARSMAQGLLQTPSV